MISYKQKQIYDFIVAYLEKHGFAPTLEEIADYFDFIKHPSSAHYHVKKLQENGFLERKFNKSRSIGIYTDQVMRPRFLKDLGVDSVRIPILGAANAGSATLFADENISGYLKFSQSKLNQKDGVFALRVMGDSMNLARIDGRNFEEGDYVLIDSKNKTPENGDYVLSIPTSTV